MQIVVPYVVSKSIGFEATAQNPFRTAIEIQGFNTSPAFLRCYEHCALNSYQIVACFEELGKYRENNLKINYLFFPTYLRKLISPFERGSRSDISGRLTLL